MPARNKLVGLSLVEVAFSLLIISIALIPLAIAIGGNKTGKSTASATLLTKELATGNSLMEQAVGNHPDFIKVLADTGVLSQKNPYGGISTPLLHYSDSKIYYKWKFKNLTYNNNKQILPNGNYLIDASLELFNSESLKTSNRPSFVMATKVLVQKSAMAFREPVIGIMFLVDMTPSMSIPSNAGWGKIPLRIKDAYITSYKAATKADKNFLPELSYDKPEATLNFLAKYCKPNIKYGDSFAMPYKRYTSNNDFIFGRNIDNNETDLDEKYYIKAYSKECIGTPFCAKPVCGAGYEDALAMKTVERYKVAAMTSWESLSVEIVDRNLPRIEIVRSSLAYFLNLIENGKAGQVGFFKIGILGFADRVDNSFLLTPQGPDHNGKFSRVWEYVRSINREEAPHSYLFDLISTYPYSTDLPGALKTAHQTLMNDKSITDGVIVLITDWNPAIEPPKTIPICPVNNCIRAYTNNLNEEKQNTKNEIYKKFLQNPNYKLGQNDRLKKRLEMLSESSKVLNSLLKQNETISEKSYQPYFVLYDNWYRIAETSPYLNEVLKDIKSRSGNGKPNIDLYIFGIAEATRPPSLSILTRATIAFGNGEFLKSNDVYQVPELFYYLVSDMDRLLKIKRSARYTNFKKKI